MMKTSLLPFCCFVTFCMAGVFSLQADEKTAEKTEVSVEKKLPDAVSRPVFTPSLRDNLQAGQFQDEKKAADLIEQREMTILKMHQTRKYILNNDSQAKELYKQMMEIAERLTVIIENKKVMRDLNKQLKSLDNQIAELPVKEQKQDPREMADK